MSTEEQFTVETLLALPRLEGLAVSPDGTRLVTAVSRPDPDGKKMVSALWELDPTGERPPRRLTRSAPGESGATFLPDGSLLFLSGRPDPDAPKDDPRGEAPALWLLPADAGESYLVAAPPGGVETFAVARDSGAVLFGTSSHPGVDDWKADAEREKARTEKGVSAQLFTSYPIRYWDHYLGPRERHLHVAPMPALDEALDHRDLIAEPGRRLDMAGFDITPDGTTVVTGWWRNPEAPAERSLILVAVDVATGEMRPLVDDEHDYEGPACSPDGRRVAFIREFRSTPDGPGDITLMVCDLDGGEARDLLDGGEPRDLLAGFDLWPGPPVWAPDSSAVFFTADCDGRTLPYRVDVESGEVVRLADDGAFANLTPSPDGAVVYALRSGVTTPPHPVTLAPATADQEPALFDGAFGRMEIPGHVERISTEADDGATVPGWLVLPPGASADDPAPLAVLIHGGPLSSWSGWHWRWSPHVFASRGYAVLLPDPAISTGYGLDYIARGWGRWGDVVSTDIITLVDETEARPDIDGSRTAALGGSFGGYMANWIAGQTDRFDAVVTHASLWNLSQFHGSTDLGIWWEREFGDPYTDVDRYHRYSPHRFVDRIRSPMLVIHGEQDYRVPIGEGLKLWTDLRRHGVEAKFLYYPDENHWVLKPNNSRLWYETVLAFLDEHVLGAEWVQPDLL